MSVFASRTTKTIEIPFDPPHTVTIQKLSGRHLVRAHETFFNELVAGVQARGGARVQKELQDLWATDKDDTKKAIEAVQADPLNGYDKYALLYGGIKSWSYPESLERVPVQELNEAGQLVTVMRIPAIDDLDDEAVAFFATEIMRLTKPSLFQTEEEAKAEQKNG